jgi:hypothetical protein
MIRSTLIALGIVLACGVARAQQSTPAAAAAPSREELEKKFAETMSGATLVGNFTVVGMPGDKPLKEDRYTLGKVSKIKNESNPNSDLWSFEARIQYGDHDVKLPLALPVKWAGDTPVISVSDVAFPGLGTYSARVVVYRDWYAGTWHGGNHGGHLFGRIVREGADAKGAEKSAPAGK